MLQKTTYETLGPILLSRSQGDSSKIKNSRDLLRNSSRTEDMKKNLPKKKLLHLYKKINFGILQNQIYETTGSILLSRSQDDSTKIKKEGRFTLKVQENRSYDKKCKMKTC